MLLEICLLLAADNPEWGIDWKGLYNAILREDYYGMPAAGAVDLLSYLYGIPVRWGEDEQIEQDIRLIANAFDLEEDFGILHAIIAEHEGLNA